MANYMLRWVDHTGFPTGTIMDAFICAASHFVLPALQVLFKVRGWACLG